MRDVQINDSDSDGKSRKKKKGEKKIGTISGHSVKVMSMDQAVRLKKLKPTATMTFTEAPVPPQGEVVTGAQMLDTNLSNVQNWDIVHTGEWGVPKPVANTQKDLLDFLKPTVIGQQADTLMAWPDVTQNLACQQQLPVRVQKKEEDNWRDDPRVQALVWEQLQQLEKETEEEGT